MENQLESVSLSQPDVMTCPFATYARLQDEAPVFRDPVTGYFEITRYDDIRAVAMDTATFSNAFNRQNRRSPELRAEMQRLYDEAGFPEVRTLLNNDPPSHRRMRSLVDKAFMPARINLLQDHIRTEVSKLLDVTLPRGHMEFMSEFAIPLPVNIISDQLGVARSDRAIVKSGSDALLTVADPMTPDETMLPLTRDIIAMQRLLADRISAARRTPDETLLSVVVNTDDEGEQWTMPTLVHLFQSILVAGNETTPNALGNAVLLLVDQPALFDRLQREPAQIKAFVEESLRVKAPFQGFFRVTTRDTELHGVKIPQGSIIVLRWGAAGHDASQFNEPATVQLDRGNLNRHLSFGAGTHFCLGNLLARSEMRIAFEEIARRVRRLRLADRPDARVLAPTFFTQGVTAIHLLFDRS